MGLDPARLVRPAAAKEPEPFELWEECVPAAEVFWLCRRQWRYGVGLSRVVYLGLDFSAVDVAMRRLEVPIARQREVMLQLRIMEDEAVAVLNG